MDGKNGIIDSALQGSFTDRRPARERVGLVVDGTNAAAAVTTIAIAEAAEVRQIWMTQSPSNPDILTIFAAAAAAAKTSVIRLGTSIVPTYPRHPLALAQQALAINDIAPDRFRLGIGPSHRPILDGVYGLP
jgi:alkanesulfonate monooxygenase SsuD/methylene tetrahydromethanopterin reductase-like flavin-dependent oxidoreductase (luciferase family)